MGPALAVTAAALHVPGPPPDHPGPGAAAPEPAVDPDDAHLLLGRKGLLHKEPATRLALCAVHRALGLPPGRPARPLPGAAGTAVVVASDLGNVRTVCSVVERVRTGAVRDVSAMEVPNASPNVVASSIAIRYGFTGPNLTVCSGATGGLDALRLGMLLLAAGRAGRVLVVGVEPADPVATGLRALRNRPPGGPPARAAAGCVLVEPVDGTGGVRLGPVRRGLPAAGPRPPREGLSDLAESPDDGYGGLGILQVAAAARRLAAHGGDAVVTCGDPDEGYAWVRLDAPAGA